MDRDKSTYGKISEKYDEYVELQQSRPAPERALPPQRPYTPAPRTADMGKNVFAAIGFGIAAVLFALAGLAFYTAGQWGDLHRDGAATGYTLVGIFLLIASIGGAIAVWNHNYRVLTRPAGHH